MVERDIYAGPDFKTNVPGEPEAGSGYTAVEQAAGFGVEVLRKRRPKGPKTSAQRELLEFAETVDPSIDRAALEDLARGLG